MRSKFTWTAFVLCLNTAQALSKESLTVLTAYPEEVVSRYETRFEQEHPDIDMVVLWRMPHDALPYLQQAKQGGVDVYWSAAQQNFSRLKQQHAWQKLAIDREGLQDKLGTMPLTDSEDYYCVTEMAGYGFTLNPAYLEKHHLAKPQSWEQLSEAQYQGHLALPQPSTVGYAPMMIDGVLQQYGWQKGWAVLAGIAANSRLVDAGATFVSDIIGSGQRGIGASIDFFSASAIANGAPLSFVYPQPVVYSPAQIAITADTTHPEAARKFVSFILSEIGQKILFHPDIRKLPVRPSVYRDKPGDYFDPFAANAQHLVTYVPDTATPRLALNNALFDRWFTDSLPRMQKLWADLRRLEKIPGGDKQITVKIRDLLSQPPISENEAREAHLQQIFSARKKDPKAEQQVKQYESQWQTLITQRYSEAEQLLEQSVK